MANNTEDTKNTNEAVSVGMPFPTVAGTLEEKGREPEPQFVNIPKKVAEKEKIVVSHEFSKSDDPEARAQVEMTVHYVSKRPAQGGEA